MVVWAVSTAQLCRRLSCWQKSWRPLDFALGLLLLLLSCFSRVRLCATPQTAAHQAPLSLGFSRQEYWSGLPFPSLMHKSEVTVKSLSRVRLLATPWTAAYQAPPSMGFSRQEFWSGLPLPSPVSATKKILIKSSKNVPSSAVL